MPSITFPYSGAEVLQVVPAGVTSMTADVVGASGGNSTTTGKGGRVQATIAVTPGETLRIRVGGVGGPVSSLNGTSAGQGGFFGGARGGNMTTGSVLTAAGAGGGGESDIKRGGAAESNRILVGGGGGGATQTGNTPGGNGGVSLDNESVTPTAATQGTDVPGPNNTGGGGGAGWRGGTGGANGIPGTGGTNMAHSTQTSAVTSTAGYQTGDGYVTLTWENPPGTTNARRFHPTTVADDQTFTSEGTIRAVNSTAPANNTATTVRWTTTTVTEKTVIPVTTNSAAGNTSNNNGWSFNNVASPGLNSTALTRRKILAGVWNFQVRVGLNTPALLASISASIKATVYRVAAGGGARTELFNVSSANFSASGNIAWSSTPRPEYFLEAGEVIMVGFTMTSASTTAAVFGANRNTVATITLGANTFFEVPAPGIRTDYVTALSLAGSGAATKGAKLLTKQNLNAIGVGVPTATKVVVATKTFDLTGKGNATHTNTVQAQRTFSLVGKGIATENAAITQARSATGKGIATGTKVVVASKTFNLTGKGVVTETHPVQVNRTFNLTGKAVVTETHPVQVNRTFNLTGVGVITGRMEIPIDAVPEAGGTINYFYPLQVFDD